ncbi:L,D-transpeptidase [Microbacterium sp. ZXX196]|uniref:L,D-transpeptidase n=1 Tax=Microbacterium sp. ZXX196 TaxID=2609291 RepID=UPI0012B7223F|nr:L,D-transpeptidase [Microbacterium sp. ZXX196]MTE24054.1 murein L,D-transpeptidase [Microbacterium sp. ZXX196]
MTRRGWGILGGIAIVVAAALAAVAIAWSAADEPRAWAPAAARPTPTATPTPSPSPTAPPENTAEYAQGALPATEVHAVIPELPVDADPTALGTGLVATAGAAGAPVFADPAGEPVAWLPAAQRYGGTTVPVVERAGTWLRVLLVGRQGVPGEGDPSQLSGWVRAADVTTAREERRVEVSIAEGTIEIVRGRGADEERTLVTTDFAWGTDATPTPTGRAFIMLTETVSFAYTRGHAMAYLSVQSPTLAGFGGQPVAVTAFHYHDAHAGAISNGCLRLGAEAIDAIAELPAGTVVHIR